MGMPTRVSNRPLSHPQHHSKNDRFWRSLKLRSAEKFAIRYARVADVVEIEVGGWTLLEALAVTLPFSHTLLTQKQFWNGVYATSRNDRFWQGDF